MQNRYFSKENILTWGPRENLHGDDPVPTLTLPSMKIYTTTFVACLEPDDAS